ncbi:MAG: hypothetical protein WB995_03770 [Candidatus Acidiferrales bacterium]
MREPPTTIPAVLRSTRIVWSSLLIAQLLYIVAGRLFSQHAQPAQPPQSYIIAMTVVVVLTLTVALGLHLKLVRRSSQSLQSKPTDAAAIALWRRGLLLTMVLAELLSMIGFALQAIGMPLTLATRFYAAGLIAALFFYPKNPARIQTH